jgi:histidinol-phosphate aminotransferase
MFELNKLVRSNILSLKPYSSARDEYQGEASIFLDANENPFGSLNRYPDPYQKEFKNMLSNNKKIPVENIFVGNGSDEVIDLLFRIFCNPGKDKVLTFSPTYGMYEVSARINNVETLDVPLDANFQLKVDNILKIIKEENNLKLIFICSPNNPSGNSFNSSDIDLIIKSFNGIVIIDEAYIDFSQSPSFISKINDYPNLVVSQTFSKAFGLAAARVGVAYANQSVISLMNKVKPPYNVSELNQNAASRALLNIDETKKQIKLILEQRDWLKKELQQIRVVKKIYPSDANFLLIEVKDANLIYQKLIDKNIVVRNRHNVVRDCVRITVGSKTENEKLINELKKIEL